LAGSCEETFSRLRSKTKKASTSGYSNDGYWIDDIDITILVLQPSLNQQTHKQTNKQTLLTTRLRTGLLTYSGCMESLDAGL